MTKLGRTIDGVPPELLAEYAGKNPETIRARDKVEWYCPKGHTFTMPLSHKKEGRQCNVCTGKVVIVGVNDLGTLFPQLKKEWNDERDIHCITTGTHYKAQWKCARGHEWTASVQTRTKRGYGCAQCKRAVRIPNDPLSNYDIAKELAPGQDATKIARRTKKKFDWICSLGHSYSASPDSRAKSDTSGCPVCAGKVVLPGFNDLLSARPELQNEVADGTDLSTVPRRTDRRILWSCSLGHQYSATVSNRFAGSACPFCSGARPLVGFSDLPSKYPELCSEWADERSPHEFTAGSNEKVQWQCSSGHFYKSNVVDRTTRAYGCPKCHKNRSKAEIEIFEFVQELCPDAEHSNRELIGKELDIYVPSKSVAIEYNGLYWHSESRVGRNYHYDKWLACKNAGTQLITVWEDQYIQNPNLIKQMIRAKLGLHTARVGARKTVVRNIPRHQAKEFLETHHIQGIAAASNYVGLFYKNKLVAVMLVRVSKHEAELVRYASSLTIVGGMDKMMKFTGHTRWKTFADHCVSDGSLYKKTGWEYSMQLKPDYRYVYKGQRAHKFGFRKKRFESDPELDYDPQLTEGELAELNGIERVYDCGKTRYVKTVT